MKNLVNHVQLIGHMGMDPEVRKFDNGTKMARMSLATNAGHMDSKGKFIPETHWHTVVAWGKAAELAEKMLSKGRGVALTGKLVHRNYEDKEGIKRYATEVHLKEFYLTEKKSA